MQMLKCDVCGVTKPQDETTRAGYTWSKLDIEWGGFARSADKFDVCNECGPNKHSDSHAKTKRMLGVLCRVQQAPPCPKCDARDAEPGGARKEDGMGF